MLSASWSMCAEVGVCMQRFGLLITHQACVTRRTLLPAWGLSVRHLELQTG